MLAGVVHTGSVADLRADWEALFATDPEATPFTSFAWCDAWLRHYGDGVESWIVCVRDQDGLLCGLTPLVLSRRSVGRMLHGLGSTIGNYWDVVARADQRAAVAAAVADTLSDAAGEWDALVLDRLPPASTTPDAFEAAGLHTRARPSLIAPAFALPADLETYLSGLSRNNRAMVRKALRRIDGGEVEIEQVTEARAIPGIVQEWQDLRIRWWQARERELDPEHASERFRGFTTDAFTELLPQGIGYVRSFRSDGKIIGHALDFAREGTFYYWLNGFSTDVQSLRPGNLAIAHTVRESIEQGRSLYDLMIGTESYKYLFGAQDRELGWVVTTNSRPRSRGADLASRALDRVRAQRAASTDR